MLRAGRSPEAPTPSPPAVPGRDGTPQAPRWRSDLPVRPAGAARKGAVPGGREETGPCSVRPEVAGPGRSGGLKDSSDEEGAAVTPDGTIPSTVAPRLYVPPAPEPGPQIEALTRDWAEAMEEAGQMHLAAQAAAQIHPRHARQCRAAAAVRAARHAIGTFLTVLGTALTAAGKRIGGWRGQSGE